jgi:HNH endonuclease
MRRALRSRDRTCRFPGCAHRRFLHAHHVDHWAHGGRTDLSNLIHLCSHHHRLVHEGGYRIEPRARGELCFRRPDGRALPAVPRPARGDPLALTRRNRRDGLAIDPQTCHPLLYGDRFERNWVVDNLLEVDPRLRE